jgi:hypothetical protein
MPQFTKSPLTVGQALRNIARNLTYLFLQRLSGEMENLEDP